MGVRIAYDEGTEPLDPALERTLVRLAEEALAAEGLQGFEVDVTLTGDAAIRELNRRFRGRDAVTDVLSFPLWTPAELAGWRAGRPPAGVAPGVPPPLGDVVIDVAEARRAAVRYGHSFERELGFLLVHGVLHLLGYDHATPEEEARMQARTEAILARFGLRRPSGEEGGRGDGPPPA